MIWKRFSINLYLHIYFCLTCTELGELQHYLQFIKQISSMPSFCLCTEKSRWWFRPQKFNQLLNILLQSCCFMLHSETKAFLERKLQPRQLHTFIWPVYTIWKVKMVIQTPTFQSVVKIYYCRAVIMKIATKSALELSKNGQVFDWTGSMMILILSNLITFSFYQLDHSIQ